MSLNHYLDKEAKLFFLYPGGPRMIFLFIAF